MDKIRYILNKTILFRLGLCLIRRPEPKKRVDTNSVGKYCTSDNYLATYLKMNGVKLVSIDSKNRNINGNLIPRWKFYFADIPTKLLGNWEYGNAIVDARQFATARLKLKEQAKDATKRSNQP